MTTRLIPFGKLQEGNEIGIGSYQNYIIDITITWLRLWWGRIPRGIYVPRTRAHGSRPQNWPSSVSSARQFYERLRPQLTADIAVISLKLKARPVYPPTPWQVRLPRPNFTPSSGFWSARSFAWALQGNESLPGSPRADTPA